MNAKQPSSRWSAAARRSFGLDLTSLAVFRIAVALVLIADLAIRQTDMLAHYSNQGILPDALWQQYMSKDWIFTFHRHVSEDYLPLLWGLGYLLYGLLLIGVRSQLAAFLSWLYLLSLHGANPLLLNAGDALLRMILLWSALLPLGARWSVDSKLRPSTLVTPHLSFGTVIFVGQVISIYWVTAYWKSTDVWWGKADAIQRALDFDLFSTGHFDFLKSYPELLRFLTRATLVFEWVAPTLALYPWRSPWGRGILVGIFIFFHATLAWALELGLFSYVCIAAWLPFLPGWLWGEAEQDEDVPEEKRAVGEIHYGALTRSFIFGIFVVSYVTFSAHSLCKGCFTPPAALERIATVAGLKHHWRMFVNPSVVDGWYVALAKTKGGREIDLLSPTGAPSWEKPEGLSARSPNHRWRKLFRKLGKPQVSPIYEPLIQLLCRDRASLAEGVEIETVTLYHVIELRPGSNMKRLLLSARCRPDAAVPDENSF